VHLHIESEWYKSRSDNVIAEIRGTEKPEEVLVLGGHFDSWDVGSQTGANDDGGGVMVCLEVLRVLKDLGLRAKRTIRFIAWSGEEMSLPDSGAHQYATRHKDENHVLAFESDLGTTKPYGFGFTGGDRAT
jgi:carboxypeptidase Q